MAPRHPKRAHTAATAEDITADEEAVLLHRLAKGDKTAFWDIWETYRNTVFWQHCLWWMGSHHEDAEDALSTACIRAWTYLPAHADSVTNAKAWLTRLVYHHCMTLRQADKSRRHYVQSTANPETIADILRHKTQEPAEDHVMQQEMKTHIRNLVDALPDRLREALILYYFQGMPQKDIANYLNLSPENVRKRLQQGRDILRLQLTPSRESERTWP